ncbi:hypothetical protein ACS0TY_017105 [Phlomoides rotata]
MGRPPSNGGPSFRFNAVEVGEMEAILKAHNYTVPAREILDALAHRFSTSAERAGKLEVSAKQVWNWFQNRRYAIRAKAAKTSVPGQVSMPPVPRDDHAVVRNVPQALHPQAPQPQAPQPQAPQHQALQPQASQPPVSQQLSAPAPPTIVRSMPQVPQPLPASSAKPTVRSASENSQMEFEAKSARDGAWYDVACFLSLRSMESGDPEAMVRFAGFGPEEDEWVNILKHIRQRSLPCESSECVAVLPGDLILCFQEGKEQALYFDAHVLDAQRRRHDVRGCRCRFLVRYDHDQSEEIVPLRKICRRPETDYRLQQLHGGQVNPNPQKSGIEAQSGDTLMTDVSDGTIQKLPKQEDRIDTLPTITPATFTNDSVASETKITPINLAETENAAAETTATGGLNPTTQQG